MTLTLDNLEDIQITLTQFDDEIKAASKSVDSTLNSVPSPEKRQELNILLDQMGGCLIEVSHIHLFLQQFLHSNDRSCNTSTLSLTPHQQKSIRVCQELCKQIKDSAHHVLQRVVHAKEQFNDCPIIDDISPNSSSNKTHSSSDTRIVSDDWLQLYQEVRDTLKDIHKEILFLDPENMINTAGKRLDVMSGKHLFIETEHEMNVLIDYGLFQYRKNGKNIVERYYDLHHKLYPPQKLAVLRAFKEARFSLLQIIKPVDEHGLIVYDPLMGESLLMIDKGLHKLAKSYQRYAVLTHYLRMPDFILTTGASTPVSLNSSVGQNMWQLFEALLVNDHQLNPHQQGIREDRPSYRQGITDLFKMAIHEDITKLVASRELPMSYSSV